MKHLDPNSLDTAFVAPGTRSLADVIEQLLWTLDVFGTRTRDMVSGLRTVARAIGKTPEEIPADPRWLRTRLAKVAPAAIGLTAKTWSTVRSNAKAGLAEAGIVERRNRRKSELSPAWRSLWTLVLASENRTLKPALCRFVHFLDDARRRAAGRHGRGRRRVPATRWPRTRSASRPRPPCAWP